MPKHVEKWGKEWVKPLNQLPDFTLPLEVANAAGVIARGGDENPPLAAHIEQSSDGGYANVWFEQNEDGEEDRRAFKRALKHQKIKRRYFLLKGSDREIAIKLFYEKFADIGGSPTHGGTLTGEQFEISLDYPLFADIFRGVLEENNIQYDESTKPMLHSVIGDALLRE